MQIGCDSLSQQEVIMTIIINVIGIGLICLVIWWFWLYKPKFAAFTAGNIQSANIIEILVKDGVYTPPYIQMKSNSPFTLRFTRKDPSPCAEIVNFNSLNITRKLPLNKSIEINFKVEKVGEYEFTCQMGMYRGKLIVK